MVWSHNRPMTHPTENEITESASRLSFEVIIQNLLEMILSQGY